MCLHGFYAQHAHTNAHRSQRALSLELQEVLSHPDVGARNKPGSSSLSPHGNIFLRIGTLTDCGAGETKSHSARAGLELNI